MKNGKIFNYNIFKINKYKLLLLNKNMLTNMLYYKKQLKTVLKKKTKH